MTNIDALDTALADLTNTVATDDAANKAEFDAILAKLAAANPDFTAEIQKVADMKAKLDADAAAIAAEANPPAPAPVVPPAE